MANKILLGTLFSVLSIALGGGAAQAFTLVNTVDGNDCGGGGFSNCSQNESPSIIKFEIVDGEFVFDVSDPDPVNWIGDISSNFPSIDGSEFVFTNIGTKPDEPGEIISATWTYTPGPNDPGITAFTVKYGPRYDLYTGSGTTGSFEIDRNALSHITFFDTDAPAIPTPALLPGLVGMGVAAWRKRKGDAEAAADA